METAGLNLQGTSRPNRKRKIRTAEPDRRCQFCTTVLSIYNLTDRCEVHRKRTRPRLRGRTEKQRTKEGQKPRCLSCAQRVRYRDLRLVLFEGYWHREGTDGAATLCEIP